VWLDPAADKILLTAAFITLSLPGGIGPNLLPLWLTIAVIGRDVLLVAGSLVILLLRGVKQFPPSLIGKTSTVSQVSTILAVLLLNAFGYAAPELSWLYGLTLALTLVSAGHYFMIGLGMMRRP